MSDEQFILDHWRSIEENLFSFIVSNDLIPGCYRYHLDQIYTAIAIAAKIEPRELPPPIVATLEEAAALCDERVGTFRYLSS